MVTAATGYDDEVDAFVRFEASVAAGNHHVDDRFSELNHEPYSTRISHDVVIFENPLRVDPREMHDFSLPAPYTNYMSGALADLTAENLRGWLERVPDCKHREFQGYRIAAHIDGVSSPIREVSFVAGESGAFLPPHVHEHSDALFVITRGSAKFLTMSEEILSLRDEDGERSIWGDSPRVIALDKSTGELTGIRYFSGRSIIDASAREIGVGDIILVPRELPHGFVVPQDGEPLEFVSLQSPPIKDHETGDEDFVPLKDQLLKEVLVLNFGY